MSFLEYYKDKESFDTLLTQEEITVESESEDIAMDFSFTDEELIDESSCGKKHGKKKMKEDEEMDDEDEEEMDDEEDEEELEEKEKTRLERKKTRAMKAALNKATEGQWAKWDLRKRAQFRAKFEYKPLGPTRGKFVKRKKPLNPAEVFKKLKKQGKKMKRLMKSKGKSIQQKVQRIKARGEK